MRAGVLLTMGAAAALLLGCGKQGPPTVGGKSVGHWVESLKDPDAKKRRRAVKKLGNVGAADPAAVPALATALKDRDAGVRAEAALALLRVGPDAREAVPALQTAARDRDPAVRSYAAKALEKVQSGP